MLIRAQGEPDGGELRPGGGPDHPPVRRPQPAQGSPRSTPRRCSAARVEAARHAGAMRAVMHEEFGDPAHVLTVEEVPTPEPGPGEVRLRTLLAAIHNHDLWTVRGSYGFKPEPAGPGRHRGGRGRGGARRGRRAPAGRPAGRQRRGLRRLGGAVRRTRSRPDPGSRVDPRRGRGPAWSRCRSARSACWSRSACPRATGWCRTPPTARSGGWSPRLAAARGINVVGLVRRTAGVEEPGRARHRQHRGDRHRGLEGPGPRDRR
ncbi:hypothetical protein [Nocardioides convexus]|uniref:hypothetical protein n=1 Tax=Nocardioides convexus TaxID=2712224 RepID=UPI00241832D6|nr:hypothetical protein [Nocardioides convexus]